MPNHSEGPPGASDFSHGVEKRRARQGDGPAGILRQNSLIAMNPLVEDADDPWSPLVRPSSLTMSMDSGRIAARTVADAVIPNEETRHGYH